MEGGQPAPEEPQPGPDDEATLQAELKAVEAELGTVDDDLAQFFTGVRYRAVAAGVVRAGPGMESAKSAAKLAVGQEILVLEQRTLEDGTRRLRFAGDGGFRTVAQSVVGNHAGDDREEALEERAGALCRRLVGR